MYIKYEDEMMKKYDIPEELLQIRDKNAFVLVWLRALYPEFVGHAIVFDNQEYKSSIDGDPAEEAPLNGDGDGLVC